jgi:hypothetical protein
MSSNVFGQTFGGSLLESSNNTFGTEFQAAASNVFGIKPFEDNFPIGEFNPGMLTGCALWFDADDEATIGAASPGNEIIKWDNKGTLAGYLEKDGTTNVYTKTHNVNTRNSVYFPENSTLQMINLTTAFLARTIFVVSKHLTDPTMSVSPYYGYFNIIADPMGGAVGGLNCGSLYDAGSGGFLYAICENGIRCGVVASTNINMYEKTQAICFGHDDQDPPTGNVFTLNGTQFLPLVSSDPAQFYPSTPQSYIMNSPAYGTAQDMCEFIMYDRLLSPIERVLVQLYLIGKWNPN